MSAVAALIMLMLPAPLATQAAGEEAALRQRIAAHERVSAANDLRGLVDV